MFLEVIEPPSKELVERVRSEFGLNERRVREAIEHLRDWLELQPHLPKEIDDARLERWLIRCKNRIEKVKITLDLYYTLRTNIPDIMTGWDTESEWFKNTSSAVGIMPMPQLTPDGDRVIIFRLMVAEATQFCPSNGNKMNQMVTEIRISEDYCRSDIYILDYNWFTLQHVTKVTFPIVKKFVLCLISGYNPRIKAMHMINVPPYADIILSMIKGLMKSKLIERIHIHGSDMTAFYEQVPKEVLPTEYGGNSGSVKEIWDRWKKKLQSYHDVFLEREKQMSDESKRPGHSISCSDFLGFEGSFRKLDVD